MKLKSCMSMLALCLVAVQAQAQEVITIESTITGSQEQPKVISIVPWQQPKDPDYFGGDIVGLGTLDNVFQPINRAAFNRERRYITSIRKIDDN